MTTAIKKKEYAAVDIFKFLCAILVIIIHTKPFETVFWIDAALGVITRVAVPFFFVSSSIFLFMKIEENRENANRIYKKYFFRLLRFYLIWYIVFNFVSACSGYTYDVLYYVKQFFFNTSGSPLWFVCALLWSSAIVFILSKYSTKRMIMAISLILFAVGYCFSTLLPIFEGNSVFDYINKTLIGFIGTQNGFFFGMPYVAMGCLLASCNFKKGCMVDLYGITVSTALLMIESLVAVKLLGSTLTYLWISAIPLTFFLLHLVMTMDISNKCNFYFIRKSSTLIYVFHVLLMKLVKAIINICHITDSYNLIYFAGTLLIATVASIVIVKLSECDKFKFLKHIM